jgi:hypothetical protein
MLYVTVFQAINIGCAIVIKSEKYSNATPYQRFAVNISRDISTRTPV